MCLSVRNKRQTVFRGCANSVQPYGTVNSLSNKEMRDYVGTACLASDAKISGAFTSSPPAVTGEWIKANEEQQLESKREDKNGVVY